MNDKNKSTITVDEDDILKMSEKIRQNLLDDKNFSEQVDIFAAGKMPVFETLSLGSTPNALYLVGAHARTLTMKQNVLRNSTLDESQRANRHLSGHDIPIETIKKLPEHLRNPILILSGQHPQTVVVVTELKNKENNNIIVPVALDLRSTDSTVNKVTTVYGKDNINKYLNHHKEQILAYNKEKTDSLFTTIGFQLPKTTSAICFDNSIAYSTQNVKPPGQTVQTERSYSTDAELGNEIWFSAVDNNSKTAFTMSSQLMLDAADKLEKSGLNYYAFSAGEAARICVNSSDTDKALTVLGERTAKLLQPQPLQKSYTPPERNIIGNAEYRYIPDKIYHSTCTDMALRIAHELESAGIQYSGNIYNSEKTTLTVSRNDYGKLLGAEKMILEARSSTYELTAAADKEREASPNKIIGNTPYRDIADKVYYNNILTEALYNQYAKDIIDEADIPYSGTVKNNMVTFTVSKENAEAFEKAMTLARNIYLLEDELTDAGFSSEQIITLKPYITEIATSDYLSMTEFLKPGYTDSMLGELSSRILQSNRIKSEKGIISKEYADSLSELHALSEKFDIKLMLSEKNFSADQQEHIISAIGKGLDISSVSAIDKSFSPEEIDLFANMLIKGDFRGLSILHKSMRTN